MSRSFEAARAPSPGWAWSCAGLWAVMVWGLGGEDLSLQSTSRFFGPLLRWLWPGISDATSEQLQWAIRKLAHVAEYAVLAFLVLRARLTHPRARVPGAPWLAFALALAFAAADETRQSWLSMRLGSIADVGLDGVGAALGIGALLWLRRRWPRLAATLGIATHTPRGPMEEPAT